MYDPRNTAMGISITIVLIHQIYYTTCRHHTNLSITRGIPASCPVDYIVFQSQWASSKVLIPARKFYLCERRKFP